MSEEKEFTPEEKANNEQNAWAHLEVLKDEGTILHLTVGGVVNGGIIAYVEGIRGFIPASQITIGYVEDLNEWLEKEIDVKVITVEQEKNRLVLSGKEAQQEKQEEESKQKIAMIKTGEDFEGVVETIKPYGAFVKLDNGLSGLIHISQFSQKRIKHPREIVEEGQRVKVRVIKIADNKLSFSMKVFEEPEDDVESDYSKMGYKEEGKAETCLGDLLANIKL